MPVMIIMVSLGLIFLSLCRVDAFALRRRQRYLLALERKKQEERNQKEQEKHHAE